MDPNNRPRLRGIVAFEKPTEGRVGELNVEVCDFQSTLLPETESDLVMFDVRVSLCATNRVGTQVETSTPYNILLTEPALMITLIAGGTLLAVLGWRRKR